MLFGVRVLFDVLKVRGQLLVVLRVLLWVLVRVLFGMKVVRWSLSVLLSRCRPGVIVDAG